MKLKTKKLKLKNGKIMTLSSPRTENAQEMADYYNTMVSQTRFVSSDILDSKATKESQEKWIQGTLKDEQSLVILAKIDEKIVGLGNINPKRSNKVRYRHVCLVRVSVLQEYWGLGIASSIMKELIEFARKTEFEQIELDVVSANEPAIHLYKKFGFVEEGRLTHAMKYTDGTYADFIKMQKFFEKEKR